MPKAEGDPDCSFRKKSVESTKSADEHAVPAPNSSIKHAPASPVKTSNVDMHTENRNTLLEPQATKTLHRNITDCEIPSKDPAHGIASPAKRPAAPADIAKPKEAQTVKGSSGKVISDHQTNAEKTKNGHHTPKIPSLVPAHGIPSPIKKSAAPADIVKPIEAQTVKRPSAKVLSGDQTYVEKTKNKDHPPEVASLVPAHEIVSLTKKSAATIDIAKPKETQTVKGSNGTGKILSGEQVVSFYVVNF